MKRAGEGFEPPIRLTSYNLPLTLSFDPAFSRRLDCQLDTRDSTSQSRSEGRASHSPCKKIFSLFHVDSSLHSLAGRQRKLVPASPQFLQRFSKLLWNSLLPTAVKTEFQSEFSFLRKGHKIAG